MVFFQYASHVIPHRGVFDLFKRYFVGELLLQTYQHGERRTCTFCCTMSIMSKLKQIGLCHSRVFPSSSALQYSTTKCRYAVQENNEAMIEW